jgi:hypothetical protein
MSKPPLPPVDSIQSMGDIGEQLVERYPALGKAQEYMYNTAYVLGGRGWLPDKFMRHLIRAILNADRESYQKLKESFPVVVWSVEVFKRLHSRGLYKYGTYGK